MTDSKEINPNSVQKSMNVIEKTLDDMEQEYEDVSEVESALKHRVQLLKLAKSNFEKCIELEQEGEIETAWNHLVTGVDHLKEASGLSETEEKETQEIEELEEMEKQLESKALDALAPHIDLSRIGASNSPPG